MSVTKTLILTVGLPQSGKSTWAEQLLPLIEVMSSEYEEVSSDEWDV